MVGIANKEIHVREVVSSNPSAAYKMDGFSHLFVVTIELRF